MSKVGILGGTYNPIHNGHLFFAELVCGEFGFERILFVPSLSPPLKKDIEVISYHHRVTMVQLAIQDNPKFWISFAEQDLPQPSYTYNLIKALTNQAPKRNYTFIAGMGSWRELSKWYKAHEVLGLCDFLFVSDEPVEFGFHFGLEALAYGVRRCGEENTLCHDNGTKIRFATLPTPGVRSTFIRLLRREKKSCRYLVPEPVFKYIEEQNLYAPPDKPF